MSGVPSVSIVINTNGRCEALANTLSSLRYIDYPAFEVCVVYGPTDDGTKELVESFAGRIKIGHCPERNLSQSRNIGIAMAAGDYVAFIDDDAIPEAEWLTDLVAGYTDARVGGVGGRVYDHSGWNFQYGYAIANRLGNAWGDLTAPAEDYNFPLSDTFPYLQGTNACFRRSALLEIGGFDEEIEFYLDETDVCCRLIDTGYSLRQLPNAFVHHKFLPSHIRNVHRVTKHKFPIIKNKIYFSIVNNRNHYGMNEVVKDAHKFISEHAADLEMHASAGRATWEDVSRFWEDVDRAWERGLKRGFSGERRLMRPAVSATLFKPFLPFQPALPPAKRKVFCLLSKEYPPGRIGGIGTYTESVARGLASLGHHVHVLTQSAELNTIDFENDVWVHRLAVKEIQPKPRIELGVPPHIWNYSGTMREELYRIARRRAITAVEAPIWDAEGIAVVDDGTFPCILSLHTTLAIWLETHRSHANDETYMREFGHPELAIESHVMRKSDGVHANSRAIVQSILDYSGVDLNRTNMRVIHHGVQDPTLPRYGDAAADTGVGVRVLFIGRLERRKGVDVLMSAVATLLGQGVAFACDVVGDGEIPWDGDATFQDVFAQSEAAEICGDFVRFLGKVPAEKLDALFRRADILVVPSRYESFGLTVVEGYAHGKAVIGARAGGIAEIIDHGRTGLLVEPDSPDGLAEALKRLIEQPLLREELGRAARAEFETRFSARRMASDLGDFFLGFERAFVPASLITASGSTRAGIYLWDSVETGIMLSPGGKLEFEVPNGPVFLHFWGHAWSGFARISRDGEILEEWDLYSETAKLKTFVVGDIEGSGTIRVEAIRERHPDSKGFEAIFYRASHLSEGALERSYASRSRGDLLAQGQMKNNERLCARRSDMVFPDGPPREVSLWDNEVGLLLTPGGAVEFIAFTSQLKLEFWRHDWSGYARITGDGVEVAVLELYSESPTLDAFVIAVPVGARIRIEPLDRRPEGSHGREAILYRASFQIGAREHQPDPSVEVDEIDDQDVSSAAIAAEGLSQFVASAISA